MQFSSSIHNCLIFLNIVFINSVCMRVEVGVTQHTRLSESNVQELVLSYLVGPRDPTQEEVILVAGALTN